MCVHTIRKFQSWSDGGDVSIHLGHVHTGLGTDQRHCAVSGGL